MAWHSPIPSAQVDGYSRPVRVRGWDSGMVSVVRARALLDTLGGGGDSDGEGAPSDEAALQALCAAGVPVLVVHGLQDRLVPVRNSRRLVEGLRGGAARLVEIDGCGHCPQEETAQQFVTEVDRFLRERCGSEAE